MSGDRVSERWFWVAVVTSPIWVLPALAVMVFALVLWLVVSMSIVMMSGVFTIFGMHEWSDKLNRAPYFGDFLE